MESGNERDLYFGLQKLHIYFFCCHQGGQCVCCLAVTFIQGQSTKPHCVQCDPCSWPSQAKGAYAVGPDVDVLSLVLRKARV